MRCILLTTTDIAAGRTEDLQRLFRSVEHEVNGGLDVEMFLLVQNSSGHPPLPVSNIPAFVRVWSVDGRCSLSAARNILLSKIVWPDASTEDSIVAFPDDDCWYPPHFLSHLTQTFKKENDADLLVCRFSERPSSWDCDNVSVRTARFRHVVRVTSSNNMFVRGQIVRRVGRFDPRLGLGTPAAGGEDTEYALQSYFAGRRALFADACLVGHPDNNLGKVASYYMGDLVVLSRFATRCRPAFYEFSRKLAVGGAFLLMRRLSIGRYVASLQACFEELAGGRRRQSGISPSRKTFPAEAQDKK